MGELNIKYEHLAKTEAIQEYIQTKFSKLEKFLNDGYKISVSVTDDTPRKKVNNNEYKILIDVNNIEKGKKNIYNMIHKSKDLYAGIDEIIDRVSEKLRRNHEKSTDHFKRFKQKMFQNYLNVMKKGE